MRVGHAGRACGSGMRVGQAVRTPDETAPNVGARRARGRDPRPAHSIPADSRRAEAEGADRSCGIGTVSSGATSIAASSIARYGRAPTRSNTDRDPAASSRTDGSAMRSRPVDAQRSQWDRP
jgi:hypothetical protein